MDHYLRNAFSKQACQIELVDIENLQSHFEYKLPDSYKDFLQAYGNVTITYPLPNSVLIEIYGKKLIGGINSFFSPIESYVLYKELREDSFYAKEPQIFEDMLPIAEMTDMNEGDYILLDLKDGKVLSNKFDISRVSSPESYGVVADSFDMFLEGIEDQEKLEAQVGEYALYELVNIDEPDE